MEKLPEYDRLTVSINNRVATVTFSDPENRNALGRDIYEALIELIPVLEERDDVGAIMITGEGKHFSAGGNINIFRKQIEEGRNIDYDNVIRTGKVTQAIRFCSKPTVAVINGAAAGAGAGIALACDFRVMSKRSKLVFAFINMGLPGDSTCAYLLKKDIGAAKTQELMMLGEPVTAEKADRFGLVYKVTEDDELMQEGLALAERLSRGPLAAYACQKAEINEMNYSDMERCTLIEAKNMKACGDTGDFREAVYAFLEKRKPEFKGK